MLASRCRSAPRLKQVYTPRVKDGRRSNDTPEVHYYNKTGVRFSNANPHYHYKYFLIKLVLRIVLPKEDSILKKSTLKLSNL